MPLPCPQLASGSQHAPGQRDGRCGNGCARRSPRVRSRAAHSRLSPPWRPFGLEIVESVYIHTPAFLMNSRRHATRFGRRRFCRAMAANHSGPVPTSAASTSALSASARPFPTTPLLTLAELWSSARPASEQGRELLWLAVPVSQRQRVRHVSRVRRSVAPYLNVRGESYRLREQRQAGLFSSHNLLRSAPEGADDSYGR